MYVLIALTLVFTQLSLLAFGGGNAILPEMQHQVVVIHQWMTAEQFSSMFALVGWHVAGPMGLIVTSFAKFGPSSIITIYALKFWNNFKSHPLRAKFEKALKPITVGLVLVSAWIIAQASAQNILLIAIVAITICLSLFKNVHPVWLMVIGAGTGALIL
jgi:chromate transporter